MSIKWIGPYGDRGGYPQASRTYIQAMYKAGVELTLEALVFDDPNTPGNAEMDDMLRTLSGRPLDYDVLAVHCVPDLWPRIVRQELERERARRDDSAWSPKAIVGVTIWEADRIHDRWVTAIKEAGITEMWTPNLFNEEVFARSGIDLPMVRIPHAHDVEMFHSDEVKELDLSAHGVPNDTFVFGAGFTWNRRKNPMGLIAAYCAEFTPDDNVALVLKTYCGFGNEGRAQAQQEVLHAIRGTGLKTTPRIVIIPQMLPYQDLLALQKRTDVGVYPYRGEGWGLHISESMLMGTPCIVTGWSGPTEYVTHQETGWLIDHQLVPVHGMPTFYDVKQNWAEPSLSHLSKLMRDCYEHPRQVRAIGQAARGAITTDYSIQAVGKLMKDRLAEI